MRSIAQALAALLLSLPAVARSQTVDLHVNLPVVLPPLVVVQPGVQVVPQVQEEVFFVDGWYWVRRDVTWYRSRDHRHGWVVIPGNRVPPHLVRIPPGQYRNWKAEKEADKAARKAEKRREKEERKAAKHREQEEKKEHHGHGHDD